MAKINPIICLAIPTWGKVSTDWSEARARIQMPLGASTLTAQIKGEKIDHARNQLAKHSLEAGCTHTAFLGDDVLAPPNWIMQMISRNVDICTGIYWTKTYPKEPYIWRGLQRGPFIKWKAGEFLEVHNAGCDCLVVNNDVFKSLPYPWFSCDWTWEPDELVSPLSTEDFYFFTQARAQGFRVWADTAVQCMHEDRNTGIQYGLTADMPQAQDEVPKRSIKRTKRLCADIGAGMFSEHFDGEIVRYDIDETVNPDIRCDVRQIPEPAEKFDEVRSHHVLEHFGSSYAPALVTEWLRILKIGGTFSLRVPNLVWGMERLLAQANGEPIDRDNVYWAWGVLYGAMPGQDRQIDEMHHRTGFTERKLENLMGQVGGVEDVEISYAQGGMELQLLATKTKTHRPAVLKKMWDEAEKAKGRTPSEARLASWAPT